MVEVSRLEALPGQRVDVRLTVETPAGGVLESPVFHHPGLEHVDEVAESAELANPDELRNRFHWIMQAGPPGVLTGQTIGVVWNTQQLELELPSIVIRSAFAEGAFTNVLGALP